MQPKPQTCLVIAKIWYGVVLVALAIIALKALVATPIIQ
jgi:hypothetical protein